MDQFPTIVPLGDNAVLVTFANAISLEIGARVRSTAQRIRDAQLESVSDVVPAYTTLAVYFNSSRLSFDAIAAAVADVVGVEDGPAEKISRLIEIPVKYNGPDLAEVADRTSLSIDDVIGRHTSRTYHAYMSGFAPGFVYLGDLDESLILPRRTVPRVRVPSGSVAIAGAQTAVYALETPGGWHLIGTTSTVMFDARRDPPSFIRTGDTVRFVKID